VPSDHQEQDPVVTVRDNPDEHRYEIWSGDTRAGFSDYKLSTHQIAIVHTETAQEFEGQGLARRLVTEVLDDARARGLAVLPFCPYVRRFISRNAEYLDLVPEARRAEFDL
jgi:predicted GNAT family acetyltransferase